MRFREIREIREVNERVGKKEEKHYAFQDIKPETDITFEECNAFWEQLFMNGGLATFGKEEE